MILVIAEERDGRVHQPSWEALTAAEELAAGERVEVLIAGGDVQAAASELASKGVAIVHASSAPELAPYTADAFTTMAVQAIRQLSPRAVVLPHTYRSRDFAPRVAARIGCPLVTDCVALEPGTPVRLVRPIYQGKAMVTVTPKQTPFMVTVQAGAFSADTAPPRSAESTIAPFEVDFSATTIRQAAEAPFRDHRPSVDLSHATRIVAVGRGFSSQEQIAIAGRLASALGAELAASRPICDNGWLPMDRQVGSSGQTVSPQLYVALGISGAIQHVVGMKGSRTIVAINKDREAPIFEVADYGIVGDLFDLLPALITELEQRRTDPHG